MFGANGINIGSAAVGHLPTNDVGQRPAVMIVTTDLQVPQALLDEITAGDEFLDARTVALPA
jgi:hypothetical protein